MIRITLCLQEISNHQLANRFPNRKPLIVIKLGGAAITDKRNIYAPRISVIKSIAQQLRIIEKNFSLIIVHGAGSYGHISVKKYGLAKGVTTGKHKVGLVQTKSKLLELESILNRMLCQHGLPVISMLASDVITTQNGRIKTCDLERIRRWRSFGCVPLIGGDIVQDTANGFRVISGDQIAVYLSVKLAASKLIFGTDVDGVFDSDPKLKTAKLLPTVHLNSMRRMPRTTGGTTDVTGGMGGKLAECVTALRNNVRVFVVSLLDQNRLRDVVCGHNTICSEILL